MRLSPLAPVLALLLAACGGQEMAAPAAGTSPDPAATPATPAAAPAATAAAASTHLTRDENGMHIDCKGTRLHLAALPAQDTDASQRTTLEIEKDGARQAIAAPTEMDGYTAVGMACVQDSSGTPYFVVQYGELPFGCSFCEWYYLYDASGRQLTHSTPPLRGEGEEQEPNNDEYEQMLEKHGIKHPEVNYIEA